MREGQMKYKDVEPNIESATLEDDLQKIRTHLQDVPIPMPSDEFFEQTRSLCHARLKRSSIPKLIWAAFAALLLLTGILMLPLGREIGLDQPLSLPTIGVLILLLQNLLMLFFTPVLVQRFKVRKKEPMNGFIDKEVCHG
jgi:hypothetical protein